MTTMDYALSGTSSPAHGHHHSPFHSLTDEHRSNQRLYNEDIAPRQGAGTWGTGSFFNWWMSAWHSLGGYTMAVGFMAMGLKGWQAFIGMALGMIAMYFFSNMMGIAGQRVGVPFPVFARMTFGVHGANIAAVIRAIVAVAWYGIQTFLASYALKILVLKVAPGTEGLDSSSILGLSPLAWICLLVLWAVQLLILYRGMDTVRRMSDFAGPTIWVAMIALAVWTLARANWHIDWNYSLTDTSLSGGGIVLAMLTTASLILAYMAGPMLNFSDFTRLAKSPTVVRRGNALGLLVNGIAFAACAMVIGIASAEVYGEAVADPIVLVKELDNVSLVIVSTLAVAVAQVGVNIILNFVSASFDFAHLKPSVITFRVGGVITAVLSLIVMPWKMYSTPVIINLFLGGVGALIGPLFGVIMVDYYLVKRRQIVVPDLYSSYSTGSYYYTNGFNTRAILATAISGVLALILALVPAFVDIAAFSWPIGVAAGGLIYYFIAPHPLPSTPRK